MIKFSAKDLKRRGNVLTLDAKATDDQFVIIRGNDGDGKFSLYILATSAQRGPSILHQSKGRVVPFSALIEINRHLIKWHNQKGTEKSKAQKTETANKINRARIKTIMKVARLWGIDDLVADRNEFEAHFGVN